MYKCLYICRNYRKKTEVYRIPRQFKHEYEENQNILKMYETKMDNFNTTNDIILCSLQEELNSVEYDLDDTTCGNILNFTSRLKIFYH